jgi:hypothetical protein
MMVVMASSSEDTRVTSSVGGSTSVTNVVVDPMEVYRLAWAAQYLPENDAPREEQAAWREILRSNWERRIRGDGVR